MTDADRVETATQPLDSWFLDLLECVGCDRHRPLHLHESQQTLVCDCGRYAFPIRDGIPILLIEEATLLDSDVSPTDPAPEHKDGRTGA